MITIDPQSPVPLNDQIKAGVKGLVTKGQLRPGDALLSIRALAEQLLVNPNTVARAYRELSHEGFLESRRGEGNFISESARRNARDGLEVVRERLNDALRQARAGGLGWNEIDKQLNKAKGEEK